MKNDLLEIAEDNVKEIDYSRKKKKIAGGRGKHVVIIALSCVLIAVAVNSWIQIQQMNEPPEIPEEELLENMNGYLFMAVSRLNAFRSSAGRLPMDEEELLGWDDPAIEYSRSMDNFIISVVYADTVITFESGDDPSELLSEEALNKMGVVYN